MWFTVKVILANLAISCLFCQNVSGQKKLIEIILGFPVRIQEIFNTFTFLLKYFPPTLVQLKPQLRNKGHSITTYAISEMCLITPTEK